MTPAMVVGSYEAELEAAAANARRWARAQPCRRRASWLPLVTADLEIIVGERGGVLEHKWFRDEL